jgi:hypothetical protein
MQLSRYQRLPAGLRMLDAYHFELLDALGCRACEPIADQVDEYLQLEPIHVDKQRFRRAASAASERPAPFSGELGFGHAVRFDYGTLAIRGITK